MGNKNDKAYCTIAIAAANVIVFLYLSFGGMTENGEYMLAHGAMYVPYILENGEEIFCPDSWISGCRILQYPQEPPELFSESQGRFCM